MIRLSRVGRANDPSFRMVVTDSQNSAKSGRFLEVVGSYNARGGKAQLDKTRIAHWLKQGVQVTDTVHNILVNHKLIESKKVSKVGKKKVDPKAKAAAPAA
ncbi:MAG: 30S ribosomal protein S16 [Candidatus Paceibacterota bacterium]